MTKRTKNIRLLCTEEDRAALEPVLSALAEKGIRIAETKNSTGKTDVVLTVLSEHFTADPEKTEQLFSLLAGGAEYILPLKIDEAPLPDSVKNALYSRNIISSEGRDSVHTAERILSALPEKKNRLPLLLGIAGALLLCAAGILLFRSARPEEPETEPETTEASVPVVLPPGLGLTEEDLALVRGVCIVGEKFRWFRTSELPADGCLEEVFSYQYLDENGESHWVSKEDAREFTMTSHDLSFLQYMPNLNHLRIQLADVTLPDLSGLEHLTDFCLQDSPVTDLSFLENSAVHDVFIARVPIADYSALNSCADLKTIHLEQWTDTDFSTLAPAKFSELFIDGFYRLQTVDLSGLSGCSFERLILSQLPLTDLSFLRENSALRNVQLTGVDALSSLKGMEHLPLKYLCVRDCPSLTDISAVGTLTDLKELEFWLCDALLDYTPITGCEALETVHLQCDRNPNALQDGSFLQNLPHLTDIGLYGCSLRNMDFLEGIAGNEGEIRLGFAGQIEDYSGLSYIKNYDYLHLNPRHQGGNRYGDLSAVLPYLEGATVKRLHLHDCGEISFSLLPEVTENLEVWYGNLRDFSGIPSWPLSGIEINGCQNLESLQGLENLPSFSMAGVPCLFVMNCPRLTDWSAIENTAFAELRLRGVYTLPSFDHLDAGSLYLEGIEGLTDLSFFEKLPDSHAYHTIGLTDLTEIRDLSPLRHLSIKCLEVPPQVSDQAEELVTEGIAGKYSVTYPDGSWEPLSEIRILEYSELETLPKALLKKVTDLSLAGDTVYDPGISYVEEDWDTLDEYGYPALTLVNRETGEKKPVEGGITDLSVLSELTGLRNLELFGEPLATLDGIQHLSSLEYVMIMESPELTEIAPLFALQNLGELTLRKIPADTLQGVQNLLKLRCLTLDMPFTDLAPLSGCDFSQAEENGGAVLSLSGCPLTEEDLAVLQKIGRFGFLSFTDTDPDLWIPALSDCRIECFSGGGDLFRDNEDLEAFATAHPELRELSCWSESVTDLTCLLELPVLETVSVSSRMEEAVESLSGKELRFILDLVE